MRVETSLAVRVRIALRRDNALSVECLRLDSGAAMGGGGNSYIMIVSALFGFGTWSLLCYLNAVAVLACCVFYYLNNRIFLK